MAGGWDSLRSRGGLSEGGGSLSEEGEGALRGRAEESLRAGRGSLRWRGGGECYS